MQVKYLSQSPTLMLCYAMLSHFSCVQLFATLWTVAHQASLSMGFPRQEYWSGLPFPSPGDFLNQAIEPTSLMSPALAGRYFPTSAIWEVQSSVCLVAQSCLLQPHRVQPARLFCPWDSPDKNTGVGYHFLFQEIFPTQGLNPGLLHCGQTLY